MTKEIRKCYKLLNLPYNADLNDLKEKERSLIKYYKIKEEKTGENHSEDIAFVHIASEKLHDYILNNKDERKGIFSTTWSDISMQAFVLLIMIFCVVTCFIALM